MRRSGGRSQSYQTASARAPIWVLARSRAELENYCRQYRKPIDRYNLIESPDQFSTAVPVGQRWRLIRTGSWYLIEKTTLDRIEELIAEREEYEG